MDIVRKIIKTIEKVVVGKTNVVEEAIVALLCGGHILIEDVPGVGKTTLAKALARSIECAFKRIQFTPDLMPSDITGITFFNRVENKFEFVEGPIFSNLVLADEINRASPKTQSSLLEAMEERQVTVDGRIMQLNEPFMVIGTQNPVEYEGTFPLPEAQLDRFFMRIRIGYPKAQDELEIIRRFDNSNPMQMLTPLANSKDIINLRREVRQVYVDDTIIRYIINLTNATRTHKHLSLGISPRGSKDLFAAARAYAYVHDRDFVLPDDVKKIATAVFAHRVKLSPEARLKGMTADSIIKNTLASIPVPVVKRHASKR